MLESKSNRQAIIEQRLTEALAPTSLKILDESKRHANHPGAIESGGGHFTVHIVSNAFSGKTTLARHRMIYTALEGMIGPEIHAIQINAKAPDEA